jgi:pyruvate dehydrogenase E1 component beta subunit
VPIGRAAIAREGRDLTILANMLMVHRALSAAEQLAAAGIEAEVIDVRSLVPLDIAAIERSVAKTGRLLIVEEDHLTGGWGAEVAAQIAERAFHHLRAPIRRVAGPDTPIPCAPALERAFVPDVSRIVTGATSIMGQAPR